MRSPPSASPPAPTGGALHAASASRGREEMTTTHARPALWKETAMNVRRLASTAALAQDPMTAAAVGARPASPFAAPDEPPDLTAAAPHPASAAPAHLATRKETETTSPLHVRKGAEIPPHLHMRK